MTSSKGPSSAPRPVPSDRSGADMIPIQHPGADGTDGGAGLSVGDMAAAHEATTGGLPAATRPPAAPVEGECAECGQAVRRCPGSHQVAVKCRGWLHEDGRHTKFDGGSPHTAVLAAPPVQLGRGPRATLLQRPGVGAQSHAGRGWHDRGQDVEWAAIWWLVRWSAAGILFVAIMIWMNATGHMR